MKKKVIGIILVLLIIVIIAFYKYSKDSENQVPNLSKEELNQTVSVQSCSKDDDCLDSNSGRIFCAFPSKNYQDYPQNRFVGNCSTVSPREGKNCSVDSDCDYGYFCGIPLTGTPPPEPLLRQCVRNDNYLFPPF